MDISETTKYLFYFSRCLGLAPYRLIRKNPKSKIYEYQKNIPLIIYSVILITFVATLTIVGIILDASSERPLRTKKTSTGSVVTFMDFGVVVATCFAGLFCGISSLKYTSELNRRLNDADNTLNLYSPNQDKKHKKHGILLMIVVILIITSAIVLDMFAWQRNANKRGKDVEKSLMSIDTNILVYIPFYMSYYIMMTIHLVFAQTTLGLGRRYKRLNQILKNVKDDDERTPVIRMYPQSVGTVSRTIDVLGMSSRNSHQDQSKYVCLNLEHKMQRLALTHDTLDKAVDCISASFGLALLAILSSALLHLVATTYFLLIEILDNNDRFFTYIQYLWLSVHLFRLILTVEPCNITYSEARKTITIVCDLMRNTQDSCLQETLRQFFNQLLAHDVVISACGMCQIDRRILTSYCGSICTYVIILIQFKKSDG